MEIQEPKAVLHGLCRKWALVVVTLFVILVHPCAAETPSENGDDEVPNIQLGEEYRDFRKTRPGKVSGSQSSREEGVTARSVLLYLPNRILDLLDIVKFDVGVGPSFGGVVRLSRYVQAGARAVSPVSLRVGLRGRKVPVFLESSSEIGISPAFRQSHDREVGSGEIGAGVDLVAFGLYLGFDVVGFGDFVAGIFGFDPSEDDVR